MIGLAFSMILGKNRNKEAILPANLCAYFTFLGLLISKMARHLAGFACILLCVSIKPKNFPSSTPKTHFLGFSLMLCFQSYLKTFSKSLMCTNMSSDLTTIPFTYTSKFLPSCALKTLSISRWYVVSAFLNPNGITL